MFFNLLKFELKYHFSQLSFKLSGVLFFLVGAAAIQGGFGGELVNKNAPYAITSVVALLSLLSIFSGTVFCASVVLRDNSYKMDAVIYTTAIRRSSYFSVRLIGLMAASFFMMVLTTAGIFAGTAFLDSTRMGTFHLSHYLQPLFTFALPNVLFSGSIIFCTALLTKSNRAIYAAGVLLYILYLTTSIAGNSPMFASSLKLTQENILPLLSDPFGLSSFYGKTRLWTDLQRNETTFPLSGVFLYNRLIWLLFTAVLLGISYRYFNFRLQGETKKKGKIVQEKPFININFKHFKVNPAGINYQLLSFLSQLKLEVISLFKHIPFMVMLLLWIFLFTVELKDTLFGGNYGVHEYPLTGIIIEEIRSMKFALVLIIFFASEALSKERSANIQSLVYSTPVSYAVLWGAKCLTLAFLVFLLITANICIGIGLQLTHGHSDLELTNYLSLYYYSGMPMLLYIILIAFIQNFVRK